MAEEREPPPLQENEPDLFGKDDDNDDDIFKSALTEPVRLLPNVPMTFVVENVGFLEICQ